MAKVCVIGGGKNNVGPLIHHLPEDLVIDDVVANGDAGGVAVDGEHRVSLAKGVVPRHEIKQVRGQWVEKLPVWQILGEGNRVNLVVLVGGCCLTRPHLFPQQHTVKGVVPVAGNRSHDERGTHIPGDLIDNGSGVVVSKRVDI